MTSAGSLEVALGLGLESPGAAAAAAGVPADPTITFTWSPVTNQALPGGATFTRASIKQEFDGTDFTELSSGTIPENSAAVGSGAQGFHPEPADTNLIIQSTLFSSGAWSKLNCDVTVAGASAFGLDETTIDDALAAGIHRAQENVSGVSGDNNFYVIVANGTRQYMLLRAGASGNDFVNYDLVNGTVTETGAGVDSSRIADLGGGIYRCDKTTSDDNQQSFITLSDQATPGSADVSYTGSDETLTLYHSQRTNNTFPTSPIITSGSTVTRAADVLDTGIAITTAFSALLDLTLPNIIGTGNTITLLGPDATAEDIIRVDASFNIIMDDGGTPVTIGTSSAGARIKVVYGRDPVDRSASLDGATAVDGDAPGAGHVGENFELGSRAGVNQSRCIHHLTTLYDEKKSDAELEALAA